MSNGKRKISPAVLDLPAASEENDNYREVVWTGKHLQSTIMSIEDNIGLEIHRDADQVLFIQEGEGTLKVGSNKQKLRTYPVKEGSVIFVPMGTWHDVVNTEKSPLKLISFYSPPQHAPRLIQATKEEAEKEEEK
jgi:mannose-6-phosphate isomerase-like protein (cupin superfamily)